MTWAISRPSRAVAVAAVAVLLGACSAEEAMEDDGVEAEQSVSSDSAAELSEEGAVEVASDWRVVMQSVDRPLRNLLPDAEIAYAYREDDDTLVVDLYVEDPEGFDRMDEVSEILAALDAYELRISDLDDFDEG